MIHDDCLAGHHCVNITASIYLCIFVILFVCVINNVTRHVVHK